MSEYIPEEINIYVRKDKMIFVVPTTSVQYAAEQWAGKNGTKLTVKNAPFKGLKFTGNSRTGYRYSNDAIEVEDSSGRRFEVRVPRFLDLIKAGGVDSNGNIGGSFVFTRTGASTRIVGVDSQDHKEFIKNTEKRKLPKEKTPRKDYVKPADLIVGGIYDSKYYYEKSIYLGRIRNKKTKKLCFLYRNKIGYTHDNLRTYDLSTEVLTSRSGLRILSVSTTFRRERQATRKVANHSLPKLPALRQAVNSNCRYYGLSYELAELDKLLETYDFSPYVEGA